VSNKSATVSYHNGPVWKLTYLHSDGSVTQATVDASGTVYLSGQGDQGNQESQGPAQGDAGDSTGQGD
jgi:hypothetical protein